MTEQQRTPGDKLKSVAHLMGWRITDDLISRYMTDKMLYDLVNMLDEVDRLPETVSKPSEAP